MTPSAFPAAHIATTFKTCTICQEQWGSMDAFIQDPAIELVGYMPTFDDLVQGLFYSTTAAEPRWLARSHFSNIFTTDRFMK